MRLLLWLFLLIFLAQPVFSADWVAYEYPTAKIFVRSGEARIAREIATMSENESARMAHFLQLKSLSPFVIYGYTNRVDFMREVGPHVNLLGVSYQPSGVIRLDVSETMQGTRHILAHEITHTILTQKIGLYAGNLPTWANEGIAGLLAEPLDKLQLRGVARSSHFSGILSIEAMERAFRERNNNNDIAYQQSRSMMAWLEWRHPGAVARLVDEIARGYTFPAALSNACDISEDRWLRDWQKGIPSYYWLFNILSSPVLFAPLGILLALFAIRKIRRKRREGEEDSVAENEIRNIPVLKSPAASKLAMISDKHAGRPLWDDTHTPK